MIDPLTLARECGARIVYDVPRDFRTPQKAVDVQIQPDQLATFAARIRDEAMEEAAMLCDGRMTYAKDHGGNDYLRPSDARQCATAIRSLKKTQGVKT